MLTLSSSSYVVCVIQKTACELRISDWSSDVCSSDLRHALDHLDIFTDRLFAWDRRERAEDRRQEARKLALFVGFARLADADRLIIGLGVDIDETPVDLAPRRALFERRDRRTKGRVREHRAIDQHAVGRVRSEEHTSELQSLMSLSDAVFC